MHAGLSSFSNQLAGHSMLRIVSHVTISRMYQFTIEDDSQPAILAAVRSNMPDKPSWSAVRKLMNARRIAIGGVLCVDEGRRLSAGEQVTIADRPYPAPPTDSDVNIRYVDQDIVIVEKPSGMVTLRRSTELHWPWARKNEAPTLDEAIPRLIREHAAKRNKSDKVYQRVPKIFSVHRIDRDSSGLLVFARNEEAQQNLIRQFAERKAVRKYFALVPGQIADQTVQTHFIRDRGDGLRGSRELSAAELSPPTNAGSASSAETTSAEHAESTDQSSSKSAGQIATTHIRTLRTIGDFSELECQLETGRTNQIRIHLAELGHPICGDIKYRGPFNQPLEDHSKAHRLALHAAELKFDHPTSGKVIHFECRWTEDMQRFLNKLVGTTTGR